jgi:Tol biopolymer transport system component
MTTLARGRRVGQSLMLEDRLVFDRSEPFPRHRDENLWEVTVSAATGKPIGEPRRLTDWTGFGFSNLSTTRDGKQLVFLKTRRQSDVYVGEIEDGGRSLGGTRRLSLDDLGDWPSAWTPDSKAVIYSSDRNGTADIFRQGLEQRTASVLASASRGLWGARLTPDRTSYLYWSVARIPDDAEDEPDDPSRLLRIPVSGGPTEVVLETSNRASVQCSSVPDGGCILIERDPEGRRQDLYALDPVKGKGDELLSLDFDPDADPEWDLSPDGKQLVLVGDEKDDRSIRVLDLSGNLVEEIVLQGLPGATLDEIAWPASVRGFFFIADSPRGEMLGFVESTGEAHVFSQAQSGGFDDLKPSPDGRWLAYGRSTVDSNVWTIENF